MLPILYSTCTSVPIAGSGGDQPQGEGAAPGAAADQPPASGSEVIPKEEEKIKDPKEEAEEEEEAVEEDEGEEKEKSDDDDERDPEGEEDEDEDEDEEDEEEGQEQDEEPKGPPPHNIFLISELERLSAVIRAIEEDTGVVPLGAMVVNSNNDVIINKFFTGLPYIDKLDSYVHIHHGPTEKPLSKDIRGERGGRWSGHSPSNSPRPSERSGHAHLPPHLQPLPDTDDEEGDDRRSQTVPLGSGSTQEWAATELFGSRDGGKGQSYTELLQQGLSDTDGDGGVNLSLGLGSGTSAAVSRTVVVNPHPDDDGGDVTAVQRSPRSPAPLREASGNNKDPPRQQFRSPSVCRGASARPQWMQSPSPLSAGSSAGRRVGECRETAPAVADVGDDSNESSTRDGKEVWAEQRRLMRSVREESITRGVQLLRVGEDGHDGEEAGADAHDPDGNDNGAEGWEDDVGNVSPSKQAAVMGGRGGKTKSCGGNGRRGKRTAGKGSDAEGDVDGEGGRHFWSVDDIIALIRAKRDQDAHLQGMGHAYARMKPREWKWLDVATRLKKVGVDREADRMQQFKKVHHFQGLSGKQDFFQLSGKDMMSKGFSFNMDRAVYDKILGSTVKNHTINPKNVADTGAQGGVCLPSASSADPESVGDGDGGAEHDDDDDGSTKGVKVGDVAGEGDNDEALVNRLRQRNTREGMEAAAKLWVDDLRFWNEREGFAIVKLIAEARGYLVAVARGEQPPPIRRSIVLPHNSIPQQKIAEESELNAAKERALKVQGIALRVIHGWVFKSQNRQRGYHAAYQYALNHAANDIARAMWMGEDWRYCVSPMVVHHTLDMDMKLPLWFVGADIEDRHEDDGLAAYQEASIQRLVGAFTSAVIIAEATDGGRISHERLKTMADVMRMMLATTMWLMRMAGDDHRAHYDAWVFVQLTAKPTLVASMHRCFDARRHIVQASTVITDKLASPPITFIDPPMYVPDWVSIGVKFSHDATLSSPMEAKKVDWLGTGPPEDEDGGKGDEQGSGGGR
ncbi:hypothetical protein CBR_g8165 [Chara braunii]|uniref:Radial spoke head protein 9 homolog n=1 Tax=Chara braunii TaxID=69332 RepID=A0A388KLE1_CHABU|nr:hypothetical protein CBR_g8165 [Chara braunii]|eukprot:GBG70865.1 hypothetical protein CBR_g8165 [Chara braunii]